MEPRLWDLQHGGRKISSLLVASPDKNTYFSCEYLMRLFVLCKAQDKHQLHWSYSNIRVMQCTDFSGVASIFYRGGGGGRGHELQNFRQYTPIKYNWMQFLWVFHFISKLTSLIATKQRIHINDNNSLLSKIGRFRNITDLYISDW